MKYLWCYTAEHNGEVFSSYVKTESPCIGDSVKVAHGHVQKIQPKASECCLLGIRRVEVGGLVDTL